MTTESRHIATESRHIASPIAPNTLGDELSTLLADQKAKGLVSLHLSVHNKPGVTAQSIASEFLAAERAIAAGLLREPPRPSP